MPVGVEVSITEQRLFVAKPGVYELDLALPFEVEVDSVQAKWLRKQKVLQVTMAKVSG